MICFLILLNSQNKFFFLSLSYAHIKKMSIVCGRAIEQIYKQKVVSHFVNGDESSHVCSQCKKCFSMCRLEHYKISDEIAGWMYHPFRWELRRYVHDAENSLSLLLAKYAVIVQLESVKKLKLTNEEKENLNEELRILKQTFWCIPELLEELKRTVLTRANTTPSKDLKHAWKDAQEVIAIQSFLKQKAGSPSGEADALMYHLLNTSPVVKIQAVNMYSLSSCQAFRGRELEFEMNRETFHRNVLLRMLYILNSIENIHGFDWR